MERLICLILGYGFGLLQTGYLYGKMNQVDIRNYGSGNAGTTNAMRVLGKKAGIITFFGDCLKGVLAGALIRLLFSDSDMLALLVLYGGLGVVLGHNFPFYLKFKGGKGIAASAGMIVSFDIRIAFVLFLVFTVVLLWTKYVSVASLTIMACFLILLFLEGQLGWLSMSDAHIYEAYAVGALLTLLAFYKHRANIDRLRNGTENKIGQKKTAS